MKTIVDAVFSVSKARFNYLAVTSHEANILFLIGERLNFGDEVIQRDTVSALKFYRKAAKQGHAGANYRLAIAHLDGTALLGGRGEGSRSRITSIRLLKGLAEQGYIPAQLKLGEVLSQKGPRDDLEAAWWLGKVMKRQHDHPQEALEAEGHLLGILKAIDQHGVACPHKMRVLEAAKATFNPLSYSEKLAAKRPHGNSRAAKLLKSEHP